MICDNNLFFYSEEFTGSSEYSNIPSLTSLESPNEALNNCSNGLRSKQIRKKRNSYNKVTDELRFKLLEAVQKGETLKAAAKKNGINYSTAKSIAHTFRKEGRILKKSSVRKIVQDQSMMNLKINKLPSAKTVIPEKEPKTVQYNKLPNVDYNLNLANLCLQIPQIKTSEILENNFYVNYSNSPLSCERIVKQNSDDFSLNSYNKSDYQSFEDMIFSLQRDNSEDKKDSYSPKGFDNWFISEVNYDQGF